MKKTLKKTPEPIVVEPVREKKPVYYVYGNGREIMLFDQELIAPTMKMLAELDEKPISDYDFYTL